MSVENKTFGFLHRVLDRSHLRDEQTTDSSVITITIISFAFSTSHFSFPSSDFLSPLWDSSWISSERLSQKRARVRLRRRGRGRGGPDLMLISDNVLWYRPGSKMSVTRILIKSIAESTQQQRHKSWSTSNVDRVAGIFLVRRHLMDVAAGCKTCQRHFFSAIHHHSK